jgi:hypothetical protein
VGTAIAFLGLGSGLVESAETLTELSGEKMLIGADDRGGLES